MLKIINGDCRDYIGKLGEMYSDRQVVVVSDPPFNIGYKYNTYKDNLEYKEYMDVMRAVFTLYPSVIIHYPETLYQIASEINRFPTRVVSWVYNSNTQKQHRDIAFFDIAPDFSKVRQPYKNPKDKRIKERIARGCKGAKLYDWWNVNQVKNVGKEKTEHPCQMPVEVMKNIVGILPENALIVDPFMGSGTTGVACQILGRDFIGIELDAKYYEIAQTRLSGGYIMIKILIGGSPCTKWSIAQTKERETKAEGEGWELFLNYLMAKEKFKPDLFLYENNKSASQEIKDQIAKELGVGTDEKTRFTYINSALVSAQNRWRFYVTNFGDIQQPADRGILLRDILIGGGTTDREKARAVISSIGRTTTREYFAKNQGNMSLEPVLFQEPRGKNDGGAKTEKSPTMTASFWQQNVKKFEPVNPLASGKARCVTAGYSNKGSNHILESNYSDNPSKQQWDSIAEPVNVTAEGKSQTIKAQYTNTNEQNICCYKSTFGASGVGEPVKVGCLPSPDGTIKDGQAMRIYSAESKTVCLKAKSGGGGGKTGLYALPVDETAGYAVAVEWNAEGAPIKAISGTDGKIYRVYKVENGLICIKGKMYEIALSDGYWIIRKLTVVECARLQTMPDNYCRAVSDSQAYKALGNGWTAEVIIHLLNHALKNVPRDEELVVLSMYDGIGTGRYCLDKMGFTNVTYHAYEIDPYPIKIAMDNYPDIIQHGNAYDIRLPEWKL